jgi:hypothetical protein
MIVTNNDECRRDRSLLFVTVDDGEEEVDEDDEEKVRC